MKKMRLVISVLVILVLIGSYLALQPPQPPASQAFINATVITMNDDSTIVEAVLIEKDRIRAVGSTAEILDLVSEDTLVQDLSGKTLMPGFIDAHGHFPGSGLNTIAVNLSSPPIGKTLSIKQLLAQLSAHAATVDEGEWVLGMGYDDTLLQEMRHPTRDELDTVVSDGPVIITHASGHLGVANSRALEIAGIHENSPDPEGGVYVRDKQGHLTGLLEETAAREMQMQAAGLGVRALLDMVQYAAAEYAAQGVTTAQSGATPKQLGQGLALASYLGLVPFRLEVWPIYDEWGEELLQDPSKATLYENARLNIGAVKLIADGSIQGYTGYLSQPYHKPFHGDQDYRGYPRIPRAALFEWVEKYHAAGFQMAIHANGDAIIDDIIAAFSEAQMKHPIKDPRMILIHAQMARDDQLVSMKKLGITPSFFSAHTYYWGDRHRDVFMGPERAENMSPARSALELNLPFSIHMDTPIVPMSPLFGVWTAVNRQTRSQQVMGERQRISVMDALEAVTINAAWQIFREDELGSIEPGKLADLVVLDKNPLRHPELIKDIRVEQTFVGGVSIYQSKP